MVISIALNSHIILISIVIHIELANLHGPLRPCSEVGFDSLLLPDSVEDDLEPVVVVQDVESPLEEVAVQVLEGSLVGVDQTFKQGEHRDVGQGNLDARKKTKINR